MTRIPFARRVVLAGAFAVALSLAFAPSLLRAQAAAPKPISLEDYPRFKRIAGAAISTDGKWMFYAVTPNEGDGTLFVKSLDTSTVYEIPRGTGPAFSDNARWVAYFVAPPTPARGGGRGAGGRGGGGGGQATTPAAGAAEPPARTFEVMNLATGAKKTFPAVASFQFSPDGEWLLMRPQVAGAAPAADAAAGGRGARGGGAAGAAPARPWT
jgi:hypothetical protein